MTFLVVVVLFFFRVAALVLLTHSDTSLCVVCPQDRTPVTPYATGLCGSPPPPSHPAPEPQAADPAPRHAHRRGEGPRDDHSSQVTYRQQSSVSAQDLDRLRQQYQHHQHHQAYHYQQQQQQLQHQQQPPLPPPPPPPSQHTMHGSSANCNGVSESHSVDLNQYRVPSASTSSSPYTPSAVSTTPNSATSSSSASSSLLLSSSSLSAGSSSLPPHSAQDYPIRGTMSPLTCQVGGRRGGEGGGGPDSEEGGGEALSFVFGRPATSDAASVGRCVSPPASLPSSKRPLSPASRDCIPIRRSASGGGGMVVEREVLSPPPASSLSLSSSSSSSSSWGESRILQGGVCCEQCNGCLIELKRQALRLMFPDNGNGACLAQVRKTTFSCYI